MPQWNIRRALPLAVSALLVGQTQSVNFTTVSSSNLHENLTVWLDYVAAICQNATASIGLDTPTSNAPTAACKTGTNTQQGVAQFTGTGQTLQGNFLLPDDWVSGAGNDLQLRFISETAASTGNVVWNLQTACIANSAASIDPSFNAAQTVSVAAGANNNSNIATISTITTTGCSAGNLFYFKVGLDGTTSAAGNQDLLHIRFKLQRAS
jgi:hypothetical protein